MLPGILKPMKRGGYLGATGGFTIVEVLIVLAVSSILLVSAITLINGRQGRAEFTTGVNSGLQQIQQLINETGSGYYPNDGDFTCIGNAAGPVKFSLAPQGSTSQGTNSGCIFLGKALQFGTGSNPPNNQTVEVLPIVGNQYQNTGGVLTPVLTVAASVPRAAYPANAGEYSNVPTDTATQDTLEDGLQLATGNKACGLSTTSAICYLPTAGGGYTSTGMVAFISGDSSGNIAATSSGSTSNLQSGEEQLSLYGVKSPSIMNITPETASADLGSLSRSTGLGNLDPAKEALVCVADVGTNESGLYTISGTGNLSVTLNIITKSVTC